MQNSLVLAAAEGLPNFSRRSILAGALPLSAAIGAAGAMAAPSPMSETELAKYHLREFMRAMNGLSEGYAGWVIGGGRLMQNSETKPSAFGSVAIRELVPDTLKSGQVIKIEQHCPLFSLSFV